MYHTKNVTFRCYEIDASAIDRAAAQAGKSLSDYCRDIVIPWAYSDIGEHRPNLPSLEPGRYANMVEAAAKKAGMTRADFERHAAEAMAAAALGVAGPEESGGSGERLRVVPPRPERQSSRPPRQLDGRYASNGALSGKSAR